MPGEKLDLTEPPSEAFDRRKFVVLMGESRDGLKQQFLPILRGGNGKFFGFGEPQVPGAAEMKGGSRKFSRSKCRTMGCGKWPRRC